jgi:hypothetical protein
MSKHLTLLLLLYILNSFACLDLSLGTKIDAESTDMDLSLDFKYLPKEGEIKDLPKEDLELLEKFS